MNGETRNLVVRPPVHLALAAVVLGGLLYVFGQYIASQPQRIQQETEAKREIAVQGRGEIRARPEVARLTLSVETGPQPTAKAALDLLTRRFTAVGSAVKALGIAEEDVKTTNLSINPQYDYVEGRQALRGFVATESVEVKIRNLETIGEVLARTTLEGVNQAGGISFELDDPEKLREQAEEKAIQDARENAQRLAKALGVALGPVKSFSVASEPTRLPPVFAERALTTEGGAAGPPVPSGSLEITAMVTMTYSLR